MLQSQSLVCVTDASHLLNVSVDTIRRWEKKGLIKAVRSSQGHRLFCPLSLQAVQEKLQGQHKGEYRVLFNEKPSPYKVIELFAGAGGLALGMENAGLACSLLVEIDKTACSTLKTNRPDWSVVCQDVATVDFQDFRADVVAGEAAGV